MFDLIQSDPARFFDISLYRVPAVLLALVLHECAHGYAAYLLGDPTAKQMGRLSLNPLAHLDLVGTVLLVFAGFGWAKPVPVDPRNFKHPRRDDLIVSVAGVTVNLVLFITFTIACVVVDRFLWLPSVYRSSDIFERLLFNDGTLPYILYGYASEFERWFSHPALVPVLRFCAQFAMINLYLALFNLIPVPPLDGSHVLNDLVLKRDLFASPLASRIGMGVMLLLSFSGLLGTGLSWAAGGVQRGLLTLFAFGG